MYYFISFDTELKDESQNLLLPKAFDLAILNEKLELHDSMQIRFPPAEDMSNETILQCWHIALGNLITIISQTEERWLVLPTSKHQTLFHIFKSKCKMKSKATKCGDLEKLIAEGGISGTDGIQEYMTIEEMVSIAKAIGAKSFSKNHEVFPQIQTKEDKRKNGILMCSSYYYIADARSGKFHKKDSKCLKRIPAEYWQGLGKNAVSDGYTPCPSCYGKSKEMFNAVPSDTTYAQSIEKRLIDGKYAAITKIIARCHVQTHPGFLTKNLVAKHKCIEKDCTFFEKLKPDYWISLEITEKKEKERRQKRKEANKLAKDRNGFIKETLEECGCIYVTSIQEDDTLVGISYIYDRKVDLMPKIIFLRKELGKIVKLQARIGSVEAIEKLIKKPRRETREVTDVRKAPKIGNAAKKRLAAIGVYCLEDLFGRNADALYKLDCERSGKPVNRRYIEAYRSAVEFANGME